ncbi:Ger(x)C family spore germination protein [Paenibacillus antibioticophila]|uniref:Ger(x)C family spore germination protein n=1 Tax=Paenibacillus antibioticophila TaxID=1274374 RepID=UPI0005CA2CE5|nr:Ger(x)C family spore germination protein [Paenibacillus antibioticophila]
MKRSLWAKLCVIGLLVSLLSGCQFKDIDKRSFVLAIGVDRPEDPETKHLYEVTLKTALPEGDPTARTQESIMITQVAPSIPEAVRLMKSKIDKELDFSHCKVVVYGQALAKENIAAVLDWTTRRRDLQLIMYCAVGVPNAKEVIQMQPKTERVPGNALILSLSKDGSESPFVHTVYSFDLARKMTEHGIDPIMPVVHTQDPDMLVVNKLAVFNKSKMVGTLTPDETRLFNLLATKNLITSFRVMAEGNAYDYYLESSKSEYKINPAKAGKATVSYKVSGSGTIEMNDEGIPVTGPVLREVSRAANEQWEKDVKALCQKFQGLGVDPLGWGLRYFSRNWNNEQEVQQWKELYPELEFQVKADVKMKYTGLIR